MNTVNCPGCNRAVNPNQARCLYCGENIRGPEKTCPACNRPANPKQKRCMYCGENISGKSARVCTKCGRPGSVGQKRCFYCGGSFPEEENKEEKQCTACGTILEEHQNFCIECGTPYGEQKSATEIPGLPDDFEFPRNRKTIIRSMVCSGDYMEVEKGFPPDTYRINWNDIRKVNCYKIDVYEDEDEIAPGPNMSRETAAKVARFWAKKLDVKTTDDSLFTFYIVEIFLGDNEEREFMVDNKFNYGKSLGPKKEFNRLLNFKKLIKNIASHLPPGVKLNSGFSYILAD